MYGRDFDHARSSTGGTMPPKAVTVPHRDYAEAVHFMWRSGREDVPIEAIVALVAYVRKDCEAPSAQFVEDLYWELVAESRKEIDLIGECPSCPFSLNLVGGPIDHELLSTIGSRSADAANCEASDPAVPGGGRHGGRSFADWHDRHRSAEPTARRRADIRIVPPNATTFSRGRQPPRSEGEGRPSAEHRKQVDERRLPIDSVTSAAFEDCAAELRRHLEGAA